MGELGGDQELAELGYVDHRDDTEWVVAVDPDGNISIIDPPRIHHAFFENGYSAEQLGVVSNLDLSPGLWALTCSFYQHLDDFEFRVKYAEKIITFEDDLLRVHQTSKKLWRAEPNTVYDD